MPVVPADDSLAIAHKPRPKPTAADVGIDELRAASDVVARMATSSAIAEALAEDGRSLRKICADTGLDPAFVSKLANGTKGANVASVALIALALGKSLTISID